MIMRFIDMDEGNQRREREREKEKEKAVYLNSSINPVRKFHLNLDFKNVHDKLRMSG